jgi:hypothetical protein
MQIVINVLLSSFFERRGGGTERLAKSKKIPVIPSVIHHRQNPLESTVRLSIHLGGYLNNTAKYGHVVHTNCAQFQAAPLCLRRSPRRRKLAVTRSYRQDAVPIAT